jgi:hypothetical protein
LRRQAELSERLGLGAVTEPDGPGGVREREDRVVVVEVDCREPEVRLAVGLQRRRVEQLADE